MATVKGDGDEHQVELMNNDGWSGYLLARRLHIDKDMHRIR